MIPENSETYLGVDLSTQKVRDNCTFQYPTEKEIKPNSLPFWEDVENLEK